MPRAWQPKLLQNLLDSKNRCKPLRRKRCSVRLGMELLEDRITPTGNIAAADAYLVNGSNQPLTVVNVGQWVYVHLDFTTQGLPANASYRASFTVNGLTINASYTNAGAGSSAMQSWYYYWGAFVATPGTNQVTATIDPDHSVAETTYADNSVTFTFTAAAPAAGSLSYTVAQIRAAYGINSIPNFGSAPADGSGQTIAIVDGCNDPTILTDLDGFDQAMRLTTTSSQTLYDQYGTAASILTVYDQTGTDITNNIGNSGVGGVPPLDPTGEWEGEETMDVEWAHAIAPGAHIDLIECQGSGTYDGLFVGATTAAKLPGVTVVSMSWIWYEAQWIGSSGEQTYDSNTFVTQNGHPGVTFLASSGDGGTPGGYPAFSPNVVAVGGTTLSLNNNAYASEVGWSFPTPRTLNNGSASYSQMGSWAPHSGGFSGTYSTAAAGSSASAAWTTIISAPDQGWDGGTEVSATWLANAGNATNARYSIYDGNTTTGTLLGTVTVDQTKAPNGTIDGGSAFQELGVYYPQSGSLTVVLNANSSNGTVVADAVGIAQSWSTGGGQSKFESEPTYQLPFQNTGYRTTPDVSFDADFNSGVTCFQNGRLGYSYGGTSLSSPCWAGLIAIANQGLVAGGGVPLNSPANPMQSLQALYSLPPSDFQDITSGYNGLNAGVGYDELTGRGSPIANTLIPDLVNAVLLVPTSVEASNQTAVFSEVSQSVTLSATVTGSNASPVNAGTVTFSVFSGSTQIGTSVTSTTVVNSTASALFTLPAGTPAGFYTIHVSYSGATHLGASNNFGDVTFPTLTVQQTGAIVSNGQAGYSETGTGWASFSDPNAYNGNERYAAPGSGANTAAWQVNFLAPGTYNVEVTWTPYMNRATNATYKVYDGTTLLGTITVNQTQSPTGGVSLGGVAFQNFGRFTVTSGALKVVLTDNANGYVIANAVDVQPVTLPAVVDNSQFGYSESGGGWTSFSDPGAYLFNERYAAPGVGNNTATWQTNGLAPGVYDVQVDWTAYSNRADNATYKVYDGATLLATVHVDQQLAPATGATVGGVTFQSLGRFTIGSGTLNVVLSDNADGYVIADAMLVELATLPAVVDNSQGGYSDTGGGWASFMDANAYFGNERYVAPGTGTNTATWQAPGLAPGIYDVQVDWTAFANRATNATYQIYDGTTLLGTATIDQTKTAAGGATINGITFQSLGRFTINSGTVKVVLSDNANGYVIADAMLAEVATLPAVIDNSQGGYSDAGGGWASFNDANAYLGNERYVAPGTGSNTATWQTSGLANGPYNVYVDWTPFAGRATNATYQIFDGTTLLATTSIDQTHAPSSDVVLNGVPFQSLGRFPITSGTVKVVLSDNANGYVIADAMYVKVATGQVVVDNGQYGYAETGAGWTSFNDPNAFNGNERYAAPGMGANTASWSVPDLAAGTYNVQVDWTAYANRATNATYQVFDGATLLGTVTVNQQVAPTGGSTVNGVTFQSLGHFTISSGTLRVVLTDNANGYVIADAMLAV
jgi:subtilase family serine protease